ncbi:MAG: YfhO family protein [Actinomycetota bacterium]|nr:YfhO family protein [Actinomycetota bacterium]
MSVLLSAKDPRVALGSDPEDESSQGPQVRPVWMGLAAFSLFLVASFALFGSPIVGGHQERYVGNASAGDPIFDEWALGLTPWELAHGHVPLRTDRILAPEGTDLTWVTYMPGPGLVMWPVTQVFGSLASYNVLMILAPALAAWAAYLLCYRLTRRYVASIVGGALFGFSAYMTGQMHGHLNLVLVFLIPLGVYLAIRHVEGSLGSLAFVGWLALVLVGLFTVFTELFATTVLFATAAFLGAIAFGGDYRPRIKETARLSLLSGAIAAVILLPFLVAALLGADGSMNGPPPWGGWSIDLLSLVIPRRGIWIGGAALGGLTSRFAVTPTEDGGYLGVCAVAILVWFAVTQARRKETWLLLGFLALSFVLAMGPVLHVAGMSTVPLPGTLLQHVPLLGAALPARFAVFGALALAVIVALWLARSPRRSWLRWGLAVATVVMLLPSAWSSGGAEARRIPAFFTSGTYRSVLAPDEIVYPLSDSHEGELLWQLSAGYSFRLAMGYIGRVPRGNVVNDEMWAGMERPTPSSGTFLQWMDEHHVATVLLADPARLRFEPMLRGAGFHLDYEGGGLSVWRSTQASGTTTAT